MLGDICIFIDVIWYYFQKIVVILRYISIMSSKKMRKFLLWMVSIMISLSANAQYREGTISLQPKTGLLLSKLTNMPKLSVTDDYDLDNEVLPGALFGAELEYQVTDMLGLAAGLNYTLQGSKWKDYVSPNMSIKDTKIELGYINLPIVANVYLYKGLAVKAGVQVSFLTNAKLKFLYEDKDGFAPTGESFYDGCHKVDFSIPVGLSYEFDNHVVIDARYVFGITNINVLDLETEKKMKNSVFMLTVGYKIDL